MVRLFCTVFELTKILKSGYFTLVRILVTHIKKVFFFFYLNNLAKLFEVVLSFLLIFVN